MCPFVSADVRGGGRLRDEPKECLRRRLDRISFNPTHRVIASQTVGNPSWCIGQSIVELSSLNILNKMRTSSQFTKIGIPLIVVSFLVAVAIILAIVLSKEVEEPIAKGKFISCRGRDSIWRDRSASVKLASVSYAHSTRPKGCRCSSL